MSRWFMRPSKSPGRNCRLAAVLIADAVEYSRLLARDEQATVRMLNAHRDLMTGLIRQHGGRVVDAVGDNLMSEFSCIVDAAACAIRIQSELREADKGRSDREALRFRIGIHVGDVLAQGEKIFGDGINIAARLERLAEPRGICISGAVYEQVRNKVPAKYSDLGMKKLKNIEYPVRVYQMQIAESTSSMEQRHPVVPGFCGRPSVAVLRFEDFSETRDQSHFAHGITEDLIARLSRFRVFPVIAGFGYAGSADPATLNQVSKELGARYLVAGTVHRNDDQVRIGVQVADASSGSVVWAGWFDKKLGELFAVQDEITETIMASLEPVLDRTEQVRAVKMDENSLDAWESMQRGCWHLHQGTRADVLSARSFLCRACELDPGFASPFAMLAASEFCDVLHHWSDAPEDSLERGFRAARKAISLDEDDPRAHYALALGHVLQGELDQSVAESEHAIDLHSNFVPSYCTAAFAYSMSNRPEQAICALEKAMKLSPRDPCLHCMWWQLGIAHFVAGRYERALECAEESLRLNGSQSEVHRLKAAICGYLGRIDAARAAIAETLATARHESPADVSVYPDGYAEMLLAGWRRVGSSPDREVEFPSRTPRSQE